LLSIGAATLLAWRVDFHDVTTALRAANVAWLVPAFVLFILMFMLRAWRWSVLLGRTPFWATWHANVIGYFFNITLPLRLGEIARAYVISKSSPVTMPRALSAVFAERLIDLASVVLLFSWFARLIPMRASFTRAATVGSAAVVICVFIGVLVVIKGEHVERRLPARLRAPFHQIREGLRTLGSMKTIAQTLVLTIAVWVFTIGIGAACLKAFLPSDQDITRAGLVVVIANLGGALPSAPGGLGVVQGFATSALVVPFGVDESRALAFVLVWTLAPQLSLVLLGFLSIGRVGLSFREIRAGAAARPEAAAPE
jgi:uncharacterized protein (TIRG00374 family)